MNPSRKFLERMLTLDEGVRLKPYNDLTGTTHKSVSGFLTIGMGRNLVTKGISKEEARLLLRRDIRESTKHASELVGESWAELGAYRKAAVINMAFQMGRAGLSKFRTTLKHIRNGHFDKAYRSGLQSKWAREQTPHRAERVLNMLLFDKPHPYYSED